MSNFDYKKIYPFKWFVLQNFPFIEADFDAITNWQLFCKLGEEINKIINSTNLTGEQVENLTNAFIELQNYVNNYFENLDVQEEINNKLDDMTESGELANIINVQIFENLNNELNEVKTNVESLNFAKPDYINIVDYTNAQDKTQAITEILSQNKKIFVPHNNTIQAENSSFIKENMQKFIKNGYYITPTVTGNTANIIQERNLNAYNKIYEDMIIPSDFVNPIMWAHQKQSWNWNPTIHWNMNDYTSIVPWFQFCKNPNYTGQVPASFNIYIGKMQVLAYDITKDTWIEVYNGFYENCAFYNYYTGGDMTRGNNLPYTTIDNYHRVSVNYNEINQKALHGWLGTNENYIQTNSNYKYLAVRMPVYTDAPYGYLGISLGLDLKGGPNENPIAEQCGTRTKLVSQNPELIFLTNVNPEEFDIFINENMFNIIENNNVFNLQKLNKTRYLQSGYVGQDVKTYKLLNNSFYLISLSNMASGNVSANGFYIVATGNSDNNTGNVTAIAGGVGWASINLTNNNLQITPGSGAYITTSITKI